MPCPHCQSAATIERLERTELGYVALAVVSASEALMNGPARPIIGYSIPRMWSAWWCCGASATS